MSKFRYTLNLQQFAEEDEEVFHGLDYDPGEDLDPEDYPDDDEESEDEGGKGQPNQPPETEEKSESESETDEKPPADVKPAQTPEENARFAEQRRQKQLEDAMKARPEYQLAQELAAMYGTTPEQMLANIKEKRMQDEAKKRNVSVEQIQREQARDQRLTQSEEEIVQLKYQLWESRVNSEAQTLKNQFNFLTDADLDQARTYLLKNLRNPDLPLEQAVYALHGQKITAELARLQAEEVKAQIAGRKTPPAPKGDKSSKSVVLTDEQKFVAKKMGISEEDYIKNM